MVDRPVLSVKPTGSEAVKGNAAALREHCDRRARQVRGTRTDIDPIIGEIAELTQPSRSRFMLNSVVGQNGKVSTARKRPMSPRLRDGHGTRASRILANGMNSGLSSSSRRFFRLKIADKDLMQYWSVKVWLSQVEDAMYEFLASTNFYEVAKFGYGELGLFGTEAAFLETHWRSGMVGHPLTFGEYWIAEGDNKRPETLLRYVPMTTMQMVQRFVADRFDKRVMNWSNVSVSVRTAWDDGNYENVSDVMHLVEPNPAWNETRLDVAGKPWRSLYWDAKSDKPDQMLAIEGCDEQPFYAARWETCGGGDPWGRGPGWDALADLRSLQLEAKRLEVSKDLVVRPPLSGPASVRLKMDPGSYTPMAQADAGAISAIYQAPYQVLAVMEQGLSRYYRKVDESFFVDLFMAITDMEGVQPRNNEEIFSRNEEKLTQLGPVIDRVNVEKLGVVIDRTFGIVSRLKRIPPPPEELYGLELAVDYISTLAQAQRAVGLSTVERSLGFIGSMSATYPGVTDNIDADIIVRDYWERSGAPVTGLRDPAVRDAGRAQQAQMLAAQQAKESAPAMADAAQAAELLSRTDVRGEPLLDSVL